MVKWLGQHIYDQISRFRNHTYFEDSITISTDKSITIDEYTDGTISITKIQDSGTTFNDNDTSLMTAAAVADKIEAYGYSTATGDITGVTAGTNLSGGGTSSTVTINLADASTSTKGAASFSSDNFTASSGAITIKSGGIDLTDEVTGILPVGNTAAKVTSIVAGDGIDVSAATGDVTVTAETASDSNPGVVELATTAESITGTDTARAVTPAGLKARVSQIINLKGYSTLQNDVYEYANSFQNDDEAPFEFNADYGSGTISSSTEVSQSTLFRSSSFHVPFTCTISALQVQASVNGSGGGNVTIALAEYRPSETGGNTNDYPRTVFVEADVGSNNNNNKIKTVDVEEFDATEVTAGSHIMMMIKGDSDTSGDLAVVSASIGLSW